MDSISPPQAKEISRAVFSYFRWKGWLPEHGATADHICEAVRLADVYQKDRGSFVGSEMARRVAPSWVSEEVEITEGWARSLQTEPKLWLRARPGQGRALARKLGKARAHGRSGLPDVVDYFGGEDLFQIPEFHAGDFEIQDISSQAVGLVCDPRTEETWWEACAGEGGKLLHLSDLMGNRGLIWASDRAAWRIQKLKRRAARARVFNYRAALWDGGPKLPTRTAFDGILVDAPCSGLGTWQRNPHARWTTSLGDVQELAALQRQLLANAAKALKPGGKLVYAVCTVTRSETRGVVKAVEASCPELVPLALSNPLQPDLAPKHGLEIRSEQFGGNGMFIAAWRRRSG